VSSSCAAAVLRAADEDISPSLRLLVASSSPAGLGRRRAVCARWVRPAMVVVDGSREVFKVEVCRVRKIQEYV
jgi:hypothetical protein